MAKKFGGEYRNPNRLFPAVTHQIKYGSPQQVYSCHKIGADGTGKMASASGVGKVGTTLKCKQ